MFLSIRDAFDVKYFEYITKQEMMAYASYREYSTIESFVKQLQITDKSKYTIIKDKCIIESENEDVLSIEVEIEDNRFFKAKIVEKDSVKVERYPLGIEFSGTFYEI